MNAAIENWDGTTKRTKEGRKFEEKKEISRKNNNNNKKNN